MQKPNFVANGVNTVPGEELTEARSTRPELGAAWTRFSKNKNMEYMNVRLKMTKELLNKYLSSSKDEEVYINLVAFPNKHKGDNPKRPAFRLFEELHREDS